MKMQKQKSSQSIMRTRDDTVIAVLLWNCVTEISF